MTQNEEDILVSNYEEAVDIAIELWERWQPDHGENDDKKLIKRFNEMYKIFRGE